jgi:CubicO group peptidase (beta-lactamase class C family)
MRRTRHLVLAAVVALATTGCWLEGKLKHDFGVVPVGLDDGWELDTPENVGLPSEALREIHEVLLEEERFPGSLGMLVIKDGKLVWEAYLRTRRDRDHYHHIQSVTKSVTSLAFGIARDDGLFPSLDTTMADLFPEKMAGLDARKHAITLRHLLTMSSGLDFENVDFSMEMWIGKPSDPLRYILDKPLYAAPGTVFRYRDADPQLLGYAIQRRVGTSERALVAQRLFAPLGIQDYSWESGIDGVSLAAHGLHLRPRDLAKIGQLVLDGGEWRGRTLISKEWIAQMTSAQTISPTRDENGKFFDYGYYWWMVPNGASAWGNGGQFVLVQPARRLVIVHVAYPDTADMDGSHLRDFLGLLAPLLTGG